MTDVVERIYPEDQKVRPQTFAHHLARYRFAITLQRPRGSALDLACGSGYGIEILREYGYTTIGVDKDEKAIEYARTHYPANRFLRADITYNPGIWQPYNLITFFEALEHLTYLEGIKVLKKAKNSLELGGVLVISVPRDINDKYNIFHKSEWPYFLLKNELGSLFNNIKMYGQDWDTAEISEDNVRENDFYIVVCQNSG